MYTYNIVDDLSAVKEIEGVCEACQFEKKKIKRLLFPTSGAWKASKKLQLIHLNEMSLNDSRFYLIFIDGFSRIC